MTKLTYRIYLRQQHRQEVVDFNEGPDMACASSAKGTAGHGAEGKSGAGPVRNRKAIRPLTRPASSARRSMGVINNMLLRRHSQLSNTEQYCVVYESRCLDPGSGCKTVANGLLPTGATTADLIVWLVDEPRWSATTTCTLWPQRLDWAVHVVQQGSNP